MSFVLRVRQQHVDFRVRILPSTRCFRLSPSRGRTWPPFENDRALTPLTPTRKSAGLCYSSFATNSETARFGRTTRASHSSHQPRSVLTTTHDAPMISRSLGNTPTRRLPRDRRGRTGPRDRPRVQAQHAPPSFIPCSRPATNHSTPRVNSTTINVLSNALVSAAIVPHTPCFLAECGAKSGEAIIGYELDHGGKQ